jgi:hypothetical protein
MSQLNPEKEIIAFTAEPPMYSEATCELRFVGGRLQQKFHLGSVIGNHGRIHPEKEEWREVPSVDPTSRG